jgi:hypothetical protein
MLINILKDRIMRFKQLIIENRDYAMAKKLKPTLSRDAERALNSWEAMNWDKGDLSKHFEQGTDVAKEISAKFEPVQQAMKKRYGDTIKLYRGIDNGRGVRSDRQLFSWTSDPKVALNFAGVDKQFIDKEVNVPSDEEVQAAIERYNTTGFTKFLNYKYKQNKNNPEYYDIYRGRYNTYQTDGDNIEREIKDQQNYLTDYAKRAKEVPGRVVEKEIPVDDVVWVLMGGNAQEYIIRGHAE